MQLVLESLESPEDYLPVRRSEKRRPSLAIEAQGGVAVAEEGLRHFGALFVGYVGVDVAEIVG